MAHTQPASPQADRAHRAWRRFYHYQRLEQHGQSRSWHGGKGWARAIGVGLVLLGIAAYGFHHRISSPYAYVPSALVITPPGALPPQAPVLPREPIKPPRP
jgi:hypothetical protein